MRENVKRRASATIAWVQVWAVARAWGYELDGRLSESSQDTEP